MDTESIEKQIKDIEDEIFNTQKNKATEHHIGKLKAKIARLKSHIEKQKSSGAKGKGFSVKKTGDATVGLIGFPSIGKSTLLNQLTDAKSQVGSYEFTTLETIPGMLKYKGTNIQILDLPGLIVGASSGKGRGKEILSAIRSVDLIILMIDAIHPEYLYEMIDELQAAGIRLNQEKPDVIISPTKVGGININTPIKLSKISEKTIKSISSEYVINADIIVRDDIDEDQLIDVFLDNREYIPAIVVINKKDIVSLKELKNHLNQVREMGYKVCAISAKEKQGLNDLKEFIFHKLGLIRIYLKPQGKKPDFEEPIILKKGDTVEKICVKIHRDFKRKFRFAHIWGSSAKYPGQKVGLDHILEDEDILTIIITH